MNYTWIHKMIINGLWFDGTHSRIAVSKRTMRKYLYLYYFTMSDELFSLVYDEELMGK